MNSSDFYAQLAAALLEGMLHGLVMLITAFGELWMQHPVIGTLLALVVIAGVVLPARKRRRRSW